MGYTMSKQSEEEEEEEAGGRLFTHDNPFLAQLKA